jgi:hypothetical protein
MAIVKFTVYRTLEWKGEVNVEDPENEEEVRAAIESVIPQKSAHFDAEIEEYAKLEDGTRIETL